MTEVQQWGVMVSLVLMNTGAIYWMHRQAIGRLDGMAEKFQEIRETLVKHETKFEHLEEKTKIAHDRITGLKQVFQAAK